MKYKSRRIDAAAAVYVCVCLALIGTGVIKENYGMCIFVMSTWLYVAVIFREKRLRPKELVEEAAIRES